MADRTPPQLGSPNTQAWRGRNMERLIKAAIQLEAEAIKAEKEKYNVSINIIGAESPELASEHSNARRAVHSRSNSDVTPLCVCPPPPLPPAPPPPPAKPHPRSRSLGARPSHKQSVKHQHTLSVSTQKSSVSHLAVEFAPHIEISTLSSILAKSETSTPVCSPRKIRSEQTSPTVSVISVADPNLPDLRVAPAPPEKNSSQLVYIPSDPWTKQSDAGNKLTRTNHLSLECSPADNGPWILNPASKVTSQSQRQLYRKTKSFSTQKSSVVARKIETLPTVQFPSLAVRRHSKLERLSPVSCNSCWSTDTCKCSQAAPDFNVPVSPASLDRSPDVFLSSRTSPSRLPANKGALVKKLPVIMKTLSRSSPVRSVKCLHGFEATQINDKSEMVCTCDLQKQGWISPRLSPRKSMQMRADYLFVSKDNAADSSEPPVRKSSFSKAAPSDSSQASTIENSERPPQKTKCDVTEIMPPSTEIKDTCSTEPHKACDPLLETTC